MRVYFEADTSIRSPIAEAKYRDCWEKQFTAISPPPIYLSRSIWQTVRPCCKYLSILLLIITTPCFNNAFRLLGFRILFTSSSISSLSPDTPRGSRDSLNEVLGGGGGERHVASTRLTVRATNFLPQPSCAPSGEAFSALLGRNVDIHVRYPRWVGTTSFSMVETHRSRTLRWRDVFRSSSGVVLVTELFLHRCQRNLKSAAIGGLKQ